MGEMALKWLFLADITLSFPTIYHDMKSKISSYLFIGWELVPCHRRKKVLELTKESISIKKSLSVGWVGTTNYYVSYMAGSFSHEIIIDIRHCPWPWQGHPSAMPLDNFNFFSGMWQNLPCPSYNYVYLFANKCNSLQLAPGLTASKTTLDALNTAL